MRLLFLGGQEYVFEDTAATSVLDNLAWILARCACSHPQLHPSSISLQYLRISRNIYEHISISRQIHPPAVSPSPDQSDSYSVA